VKHQETISEKQNSKRKVCCWMSDGNEYEAKSQTMRMEVMEKEVE
jgi:hypothetical protein